MSSGPHGPIFIGKICSEDGEVDPQSFVSCQEFAMHLMEDDYFPGFLSSEFHCKHQIDLLTTTNVHLADILYNDVAMFYFSEVRCSIYCVVALLGITSNIIS